MQNLAKKWVFGVCTQALDESFIPRNVMFSEVKTLFQIQKWVKPAFGCKLKKHIFVIFFNFASIFLLFLPFYVFVQKRKKIQFDQHVECACPKAGQNIQQIRMQAQIIFIKSCPVLQFLFYNGPGFFCFFTIFRVHSVGVLPFQPQWVLLL